MNTSTKLQEYKRGVRNGLPIGLGYVSVSFSFGIIAASYGLNWLEALFISMTNLTSAGQFAGIGIMAAGGAYIEMFIVQVTTNIRYAFMSISLSQKVDERFNSFFRMMLGSAITDEIFVMSMLKKEVSREYFLGLATIPYFGWSLGTLLGAVLGGVLPDRVTSALGIALYGMFIAIVVPVMKQNSRVFKVVLVSIVLMCGFRYLPYLKEVSSGIAMTVCAVTAALIGALVYPVIDKPEDKEVAEDER